MKDSDRKETEGINDTIKNLIEQGFYDEAGLNMRKAIDLLLFYLKNGIYVVSALCIHFYVYTLMYTNFKHRMNFN